jgi:hypothetical protein
MITSDISILILRIKIISILVMYIHIEYSHKYLSSTIKNRPCTDAHAQVLLSIRDSLPDDCSFQHTVIRR